MPIHESALVSDQSKIHASVEIGPFTIVHGNVEIAEGTKIGSHCELGVATPLGDGSPLRIGPDSIIRSHSVFYESSSFGAQLVTGHQVSVRENTQAGYGLQIGTQGEIQGDCRFGDYVKMQSNVFVGKYTEFGDYIWVFPRVVFTNDPHPPSNIMRGVTVKNFAAIAAMSTILPGVTIGEGALVGAGSIVTKDVGDTRLVVGNPAHDKGSVHKIKLQDGSGRNAYPWKQHFHRGYPEDVVAEWLEQI